MFLFILNTVGRHNMENALGATAVAASIGVPLEVCAEALKIMKAYIAVTRCLAKEEWCFID